MASASGSRHGAAESGAAATAGTAAANSPSLHVVSWNTNGWAKTIQLMKTYCPSSEETTPSSRHDRPGARVVREWLERHGIDVLCIQETRATETRLLNNSDDHAVHVQGFDSFWSCSTTSRQAGRNGVATYAREGTVRAVDRRPLQAPSLDNLGRVLMTDHGDFVLFNVYGPTGSHDPHERLEFFTRLRAAMQRQRAQGRAVLLAGDINLARQTMDKDKLSRFVFMPDLLAAVDEAGTHVEDGGDPALRRVLLDLKTHWDTAVQAICQQLEVRTVPQSQRRRGSAGRDGPSTRSRIFLAGTNVKIGSSSRSPLMAELEFASLRECASRNPRTGKYNKAPIFITTIIQVMEKLAGVKWSEEEREALYYSPFPEQADVVDPLRLLVNNLILEDNMVDTFTECFPRARARYTCWLMADNSRYRNEGRRIDYIFADRAFFQRYRARRLPPLVGGAAGTDPNTPAAALNAATAFGDWKGAPVSGGGLATQNTAAFQHHQYYKPGAGIIYTPPIYSDHVPVSVLFEGLGTARALARQGKVTNAPSSSSFSTSAAPMREDAPSSAPASSAAAASSTCKSDAAICCECLADDLACCTESDARAVCAFWLNDAALRYCIAIVDGQGRVWARSYTFDALDAVRQRSGDADLACFFSRLRAAVLQPGQTLVTLPLLADLTTAVLTVVPANGRPIAVELPQVQQQQQPPLDERSSCAAGGGLEPGPGDICSSRAALILRLARKQQALLRVRTAGHHHA